MQTTLILPCAGRSTRFPGTRPKYLQTEPRGELIFLQSLFELDTSNVGRIIITVVREHIEKHNLNLRKIISRIEKEKNITPEFCILNDFTTSQSDTIYNTIKYKNIVGSIFIKDCDNLFNTTIETDNYVCVSTLNKNTNAINKGYVSLDKFGKLSGIVEKTVIGDTFCSGGYSFESAVIFSETFEKLKNMNGINEKEIYISHIIQQMLLDGHQFKISGVSNYVDLGTLEDWLKYTSQFKTIFIDLDGTLCHSCSEYFEPYCGDSNGLDDNIKIINELFATGKVKIIITTARRSNVREETFKQLEMLGVNYHQVIFDLPHAQRVLVNDYANSNPYPSAVAVNLKRNSDELRSLLK